MHGAFLALENNVLRPALQFRSFTDICLLRSRSMQCSKPFTLAHIVKRRGKRSVVGHVGC
jgi:hypothetical protein